MHNSYIDLVRHAQTGFEREANSKVREIQNYNHTVGIYSISGNKPMVGTCASMITVFYLLQATTASDVTVLLLGETGTGKELAARALHFNSSRYNPQINNFVVVNCASTPESLIESELFGYAPGAFTGASPRGYTGAFERARDGTIVLDEIGYASMYLQQRLLRVLENKTIQRLGDGKPIYLGDIRIVASTSKDIGALVAENKFHEDLFHRLSRVPIYLPALRERSPDDIRALIYYFASNGIPGDKVFEPEAMEKLLGLPFRGNVRSLENLIMHAQACERNLPINSDSIEKYIPFVIAIEMVLNKNGTEATKTFNLRETVRKTILDALTFTNGHQARAAELLDLAPRVLSYRLKMMREKKDPNLQMWDRRGEKNR